MKITKQDIIDQLLSTKYTSLEAATELTFGSRYITSTETYLSPSPIEEEIDIGKNTKQTVRAYTIGSTTRTLTYECVEFEHGGNKVYLWFRTLRNE